MPLVNYGFVSGTSLGSLFQERESYVRSLLSKFVRKVPPAYLKLKFLSVADAD